MRTKNHSVNPANVVETLVYNLLDVFEATFDLYDTLKNKERRDHENELRTRRYSDSWRAEYIHDEEFADAGGAVTLDKAAVLHQFNLGFEEVGAPFAMGDVISQTALQSQVIALQSVIIRTFLYGPISPETISHQLSDLLAASRLAGTSSVEILAAQQQRQLTVLPIRPHNVQPTHTSTSSALVDPRHEADRPYPAKTTIVSPSKRPGTQRTDTGSTYSLSPTTEGTECAPRALYCLYALDLQRDPSQPLHSSITNTSSPYCPYCKRVLKLAPGKSWEVHKHDDGEERCFRIQNRFVVKCHRNSVDGGYSCLLCSRNGKADTVCVCGDVRAFIRHVWMDHSAEELEMEDDITEVVENYGRRRDSLISFTEPRGGASRRSISVGPRRDKERRRGPGIDREVGTFEMVSSRRDA